MKTLLTVLLGALTISLATAQQTPKAKPAARTVAKKPAKRKAPEPELHQGVTGMVTVVEGNVMPGPGKMRKNGPKGAVRLVRLYDLLTRDDVDDTTKAHKTLWSIPTEGLVAQGKSKADGSFTVRCPPGKYSLVVLEEGMLFASVFDGDGHLNPITVPADKLVQANVVINHKAAY